MESTEERCSIGYGSYISQELLESSPKQLQDQTQGKNISASVASRYLDMATEMISSITEQSVHAAIVSSSSVRFMEPTQTGTNHDLQFTCHL